MKPLEVRPTYGVSPGAAKAVACLQEGFEDAMAVMSLPVKYRKRRRTTNMMERKNREIRWRERVIGIFPNDDSAHRLTGALLAETNEQWLSRRYLDMDEFKDWRAEQDAGAQSNNVVALGEKQAKQPSSIERKRIYSTFWDLTDCAGI